jgi:GH35 family endo-1,4-beta-xylanase
MNMLTLWAAGLLAGMTVLLAVAGQAGAADSLPVGTTVVPADAAAAFHLVGDPALAHCAVVDVQGQDFTRALQVTTLRQPDQPWLLKVHAATTAPVAKDDVLLATFQARCASASGDEAAADFVFEQDGQPFVKSVEFPITVGRQWKKFQIPFASRGDYPAGQADFNFRLGYPPQTLEIAALTVVDFGRQVKLSDLPQTKVDYLGRSPDAPWRQAALDRIEKLRKGDLAITVADQAGRPVAGATVAVHLTRPSFAFGSAVDARLLMDDSPDARHYQQFVEQNFNRVVFENDLKWQGWEATNSQLYSRPQTLAAADWLRQRNIEFRGHCLVWPSWRYLPADLPGLSGRKDALSKRVADHVTEEVAALKGRPVEWDVINEPFSNHDLIDVLGRDAMVQWFKLAHAADPQARLFINDFGILSNGGLDTIHQNHYEQTIRFLLDQAAPLQGLGLQSHFAWRLTSPERMLAILDRFAKLGLTIEASEFDVNITDEQLQADFTRDFYIALFSHPAVEGILTWGFWEGAHWLPPAALVRKDWTLKPNGQVWMDLVRKQWTTNAQGRTDDAGRYGLRGFLGDYEVTVTSGGQTQVLKAALPKAGAKLAVTLK